MNEKVDSIVLSLRKVLECPVCLDFVRTPIKQCSVGHIVCSLCSKDTKCPLCRQPVLKESPICVSKILELLPRPCKFVDEGCKQLYVPCNSNEHELYCGYRLISCRELLCNKKVPVCHIQKHYFDEHNTKNVLDLELQDGCFNSMSTETPGFSLSSDRVYNVPVVVDKTFFYINQYHSCDQKHLKIIFEAFPVGKPKSSYYVTVKVENGYFLNQKTIKAIIMKGGDDRNGIEVVSQQKGDLEEFCMKVPQNCLPLLSDGKRHILPYKFFKQTS